MPGRRRTAVGAIVAAAVAGVIAGCQVNRVEAPILAGVAVETARGETRIEIGVPDWPLRADAQVLICPEEMPAGVLTAATLAQRARDAGCIDLGVVRRNLGIRAGYDFASASSAQYLAFDEAPSWYVIVVESPAPADRPPAAAQVEIDGGPVEAGP